MFNQDLIQDTSQFEPSQQYRGYRAPIADFVFSMAQDLSMTPIAVGGNFLHQAYIKHFNPGQFLTAEQAKEAYPNVDFPKGGYENLIRHISEKRANNDYREETLANIEPYHFQGLSRLGTFAIANAMCPINRIAGASVEATVGKMGSYLSEVNRAANPWVRRLTNAAVGATEGGLVTTPIAASTYGYYKNIQRPEAMTSALILSGTGMALGGALRTLVGFKSPIKTSDQKAAIATAQAQADNGKVVKIDQVLSQAAHERAINNPDIAKIDEIKTRRRNMETQLKDTTDNLRATRVLIRQKLADYDLKNPTFRNSLEAKGKSFEAELEKISRGRKVYDLEDQDINSVRKAADNIIGDPAVLEGDEPIGIDNMRTILRRGEGTSKPKFYGRVISLLKGDHDTYYGSMENFEKFARLDKAYSDFKETGASDEISHIVRSILNNERTYNRAIDSVKSLPDTEEFKLALKLARKNESELTADERTFMDRFALGKEKDLMEERAEKMLERMKKEDTYKEMGFAERIRMLDESRERMRNRLDQMRGREDLPKDIRDNYKELQDLEDQVLDIQQQLHDTDTYIKSLEEKPEPIDVEDLKRSSDEMNSWKKNGTTDLNEYDRYEKDLKEPEKNIDQQLQEIESDIDAMKEAGVLDKEDQNMITEIKAQETQENKITDALKEALKCFMGAKE